MATITSPDDFFKHGAAKDYSASKSTKWIFTNKWTAKMCVMDL